MPTVKLTRKFIHDLTPPAKGQVDYFDTDLARFGLRVTTDSMTFMIYRRIVGEANKTYVPIGKYGEYTIEEARKVAREYIQQMKQGINPHPKHKPQSAEILTLAALFSQHKDARKTNSPGTIYQYNKWMDNYFKDWHERDVTKITGKECVDRLAHIEKTNGTTQAANAMKLLRTLYNFGMALHPEVVTFNPLAALKALKLWKEQERRETLISASDLPAWFKAVNECSNPKGRDYLLVLLFTGIRKMEAARLEWADIDFRAKTFSFIPEKKGNKAKMMTMPLSGYLQRVLLKRYNLYRETSEYVFPGRNFNTPHMMNAVKWVDEVKAKSGVSFCLHDLRRTFITIAESLDIPHYALKALLNHSMGNDVTGGYIQINAERLREPTERVAARIMKLATAKVAESESKAA